MARFLALDWDQEKCCILAGNLNRGSVAVECAVVWHPETALTDASAEDLGRKLREFLKKEGLPSAPVLACLGRERILLKEIRFPAVTPREEPALVRFQATRELLDAHDEMVLDYARLDEEPAGKTQPSANGEKRALVAALPRNLLAGYQTFCRAAGLKLLALVPRPFIVAGFRTPATSLGESITEAVLLLGSSWAELTVLRGSTVLFARSLPVGTALEGEVRRSLAVFAAQSQGQTIQHLLLLGQEPPPELAGNLQEALAVKVARLLPSVDEKVVPRQGAFASALCLLECWAQGKVPVNFVRPKEPPPETHDDRRKLILIGGVGFLLLLGMFLVAQVIINQKKAAVQEFVEAKADDELALKRLTQDKLDLEALKEWDQNSIPWLDEFYDLTARFPYQIGFHLNKVHAEPLKSEGRPASGEIKGKSAGPRFVAKMNLVGIVPTGQDALIDQFLNGLRDDHLQARMERFKGGSSREFSLKVDISRQVPKDYVTRLVPPPEPPSRGRSRPSEETGGEE